MKYAVAGLEPISQTLNYEQRITELEHSNRMLWSAIQQLTASQARTMQMLAIAAATDHQSLSRRIEALERETGAEQSS